MWVIPTVELGDEFDGCPDETFGGYRVYRGEGIGEDGTGKTQWFHPKL